MWYKVRTKSILVVDPVQEDEKELQEELAQEQQLRTVRADRKCISCNSAIQADAYQASTLVEITENEYGFVCPECTHETYHPAHRKIPIQ